MPNRLAAETSPYLRQHAANPVDWWPWCEQALALARSSHRPILLSIGYSSCHWCHVMAHESFEDEATAAVMNALFVNIKVDREERPDLDRIYQLAHQALTRRGGGWPLTVFLTPDDHLPYFAGTYFPRTPRYGMPPFVEVLKQVRQWYDRRRNEVMAQNAALGEFLRDYGREAPADTVDPAPLADGVARIAGLFDPIHGGFGAAPKFPHATDLRLLMAATVDGGDEAAAHFGHIVRHTLRKMAEGGIHDQLGGGFCRYSVDAHWAIPHFEKMLYDNALLLPLYARAAAETGEAVFAEATQGIADWLAREMKVPDGGYYAALDADSEGEEGKFYVWQHDEFRSLLDDEEFAVAVRCYGLDQPPNFEGHAWNLLVARPLADVASALDIDNTTAAARLASAKSKLTAARAGRVRPGLDDKRLTAWNALLAAGFAEAAMWSERADFAEHARDILALLRAHAWRDGRLLASVREGQPHLPAYLDDHAFLLAALLEALRIDPDPTHLRWAVEIADLLLDHFEDADHGGFFFTANDHESLIVRLKPLSDESMPSGNGVAALALLRLGHLLGETRYLDAAERGLRAATATLKEIPHGCAALLLALREHQSPSPQIVVRLPDDAEAAEQWRLKAQVLGQRDLRCVLLPPDDALLPQYAPEKDGVAYVCEGTRCLAPARSLEEVEARLEEIGAASAV